MDSGDRPDYRLTASDSQFGGIRSHSFSNLFQGFFGVRPAPSSACDIPSSGTAKTSEEQIAGPVVSPSNDDSWILSHILSRKHEREGDADLRRNVTWSALDKSELFKSEKSSAASSLTDVSKRIDNVSLSHTEISSIPLPEESTNEADHGFEKIEKTESFLSKDAHHSRHTSTILSSFLMHDMSYGALKPREGGSSLERSGSLDRRMNRNNPSQSSGSSPDLVDHSGFPAVATSKDKLPESKHTLRDILWNFNHEKINVSHKEMNLIASIDQ